MKTRYMVVTADSWRILARGFSSWEAAQHWALSHDYGQWEDEGGAVIRPYTVQGFGPMRIAQVETT